MDDPTTNNLSLGHQWQLFSPWSMTSRWWTSTTINVPPQYSYLQVYLRCVVGSHAREKEILIVVSSQLCLSLQWNKWEWDFNLSSMFFPLNSIFTQKHLISQMPRLYYHHDCTSHISCATGSIFLFDRNHEMMIPVSLSWLVIPVGFPHKKKVVGSPSCSA